MELFEVKIIQGKMYDKVVWNIFWFGENNRFIDIVLEFNGRYFEKNIDDLSQSCNV